MEENRKNAVGSQQLNIVEGHFKYGVVFLQKGLAI